MYKIYHGMHKYQQLNFFSNVVKYIRPTYGNKELAPLTDDVWVKAVSIYNKVGNKNGVILCLGIFVFSVTKQFVRLFAIRLDC